MRNQFHRHFEEILASSLLLSLCIVVSLQVFSRYVLLDPYVWAEELARTIFIWTSFMGAVIALKQNRHFAIDLLVTKMRNRDGLWTVSAEWTERVSISIVILLLVLLSWVGVDYAWSVRKINTDILEISQAWNYMALPISCLFMIVRTLPMLVNPPVATEQTVKSE